MRISFLSVMVVAAGLASSAQAQTLSALSSFGGGDGWRAPSEVITGDTAGTATAGAYNYLQAGSLERGLAYNPVTGNLILVSRSTAGNGIRVLSGSSGADVGFLNQGTGIISGGAFTTNMVGVADDGAIYVGNLATNVSTTGYKVYQWTSEAAAAPTVFSSNTVAGFTGTPRIGDSLDAFGSGASTTLVAGASGSTGYVTINSAGTASAVAAFAPAGPGAGDFRLGITFAGSATEIWGKQTGASAAAAPLRRTTTAGVSLGSSTLTSGGEMAMDYAMIGGVPYLAVVNANSGGTADSTFLTVYNVSTPATPVVVTFAELTTGALTGNANATGSVKWGAISGSSATVYAMSTNHGIQAFTFAAVPEASSFLAVGAVGMLFAAVRRLRRK